MRWPHHRSRLLLVAVGALVAVSSVAAGTASAKGTADWPIFDHDNQHTALSNDTTVAASTAAALTFKWETAVGGGAAGSSKIWGSPVVAFNRVLSKNVVYITNMGDHPQLTALDASTGAVLWLFDAGAAIESSPTVAGNTVYFGSNDHMLYAVNAATGQLECSFSTGGTVMSSAVVANVDGTGNTVFFGDSGLNGKSNGGHEWAINGAGSAAGACTLKWVFNSWNTKGRRGNKVGSWSSPALGRDPTGRLLVVFGSSDPDDSVYALDAMTGAEVWRFQTVQNGADQDVGAPPTIGFPGRHGITGNGLVFINGKNKIEYALDLLTGAEMWEFNMAADAGTLTNSVSSTALVDGLVVVNYYEYTYALSPTTGAVTWRSPARSATTLASPSVSGPPGDRVVFTGDLSGAEDAYSLKDGSIVASWTISVPPVVAKILSSSSIADSMVVFGSADGNVWALGFP